MKAVIHSFISPRTEIIPIIKNIYIFLKIAHAQKKKKKDWSISSSKQNSVSQVNTDLVPF